VDSQTSTNVSGTEYIPETILDDDAALYANITIVEKMINNLDKPEYKIYFRIINYKLQYSIDIMEKLNNKIRDIWDINIKDLYNIDDTTITTSMKLYLDILNGLHFQLPDILHNICHKNKYTCISDINNINEVIKSASGKLKDLFRNLDSDGVYKILSVVSDIYYPLIFDPINSEAK